MFKDLILTKIVTPKLHSKILMRERIKKVLTHSYTKIWTIIAEPGYGKTSCLLELKKYVQFPSAWYSLDENDNNIIDFVNHLIYSIKRIYPSFGKTLNNILQSYPDYDKGLDIKKKLLNELIDLEKDLLIIFDNYYKINNNKAINDFIQFLINYLPPNVYIAIASRKELPFDFNNFFLISQIMNIKTKDLKFTIEESQQLCELNSIKPSCNIKDILKLIDGWVLGLLLFIQNFYKFNEDDVITHFKDLAQTTIDKYFQSEIMNLLPEGMNNFVILSSLLDSFDLNICQNIFDFSKDNLIEYFKYIEQNNVFIESYYAHERLFYKYHDLFRQFLLKELEKLYSSDEIKTLYKKIGDYYANQQLHSFSINQYLLAHEFKLALDLIKKNEDIYFVSAQNSGIENCLSKFPYDILVNDPFLLKLQGKLCFEKGHVNKAINFYEKAEKIYIKSNDYINLFKINCTLATFFLYNIQKGQYDIKKSEKYLTKAKLYQKYVPLKERMILLLTEYYLHQNATEKDIKILNQIDILTSDLSSNTDIRVKLIRVNSLHQMGKIYRLRGEIDKAVIYFNKAINEIKDKNNNYLYYIKGTLAEAYLFIGEIETGLSLIKEIEKWIKKSDSIDLMKDKLVILSLCPCLLYFDDADNVEKAKSYLKQVYNYFLNIDANENSGELIITHTLSALIACKENLFSYAIELYEKLIKQYSKNSYIQISILVLDYIFTLLLSEDFEKTIEVSEEYLKTDFFSYPYQQLQAQIYLCTAYLKLKETDKGLNLLKMIIEQCKAHNNEYLIITRPEILKTLLPLIFLIDEQEGINLLDKSLLIYKCNVKPYLLNTLIFSVPPLIIYENEKLVQNLETLLKKSFILIRAFGRLEVKIGSNLLKWQRQGLKTIFALLLLHPEGITSEKLQEKFFPKDKKEKASHNLRNLIYYLRQLLEPDIEKFKESNFILYENGIYKLSFARHYLLLDIKEFLNHYQKGFNFFKENDINKAYEEYKKAAGFYRGNLLEDIDLIDIESTREYYRNKYLNILLFLIEYSFNENKLEDCIYYSEQILNYDKYEERAYCYLMKAYFKKGRKDLITTHYRLCRKTIEKKLGMQVSTATENLYNELMAS